MLILYTSAQISNDSDLRHKEYLRGWNSLGAYKASTRVLECFLQTGPSMLEKEGLPVYYVGEHIPGVRNKGMLEAISLANYLIKTDTIKDSELLVKLTGRYSFTDFLFLEKAVSLEKTSISAIVKYDTHGQVFTGCFAIRKGLLLGILSSIDYTAMESKMINFERIIANSLASCNNVEVTTDIGLIAPIFGVGSRETIIV